MFMDAKLYQASIVNDIDVVSKCLVFPEKNYVLELRALTITLKVKIFKCWNGQEILRILTQPKNIWAYLKRAMQQITYNSKEQLWKAVQHHW